MSSTDLCAVTRFDSQAAGLPLEQLCVGHAQQQCLRRRAQLHVTGLKLLQDTNSEGRGVVFLFSV